MTADGPSEEATAARPLTWTPALVEAYWRGAHAAGVPAAGYERNLANSMAAVLAGHIGPGAEVLEVGGRSAEAVATLLWCGFRVTRLNAQSLCEALPPEILAAEGFRGQRDRPPGDRFDAVASLDGPARILEGELRGYAALLRSALRPGGLFCFTVPNGATIEFQKAIDPETGTLFHPLQHMRSYTTETVQAWLAGEGFETLALHQVGIGHLGTAGESQPFARMAAEPRTYSGNGDTMIVVARWPGEDGAAEGATRRRFRDAAAAELLLGTRHRAQAEAEPVPARRHDWTPGSTNRFWSLVATSALGDLSFGAQNGAALLAAVEPWLAPEGRHVDIGAGDGHVVALLCAAGFRAGALEPAAGRRAMLDQRMAGRPNYLGCFAVPERRGFEVALALEVIEHIGDDDLPGFLELVRESLTEDGVLILSTPCREDLSRSAVYAPLSGAVFHRWQHLQSWTPERLEQLLGAHGFVVEVTHEIDLYGIQQGRHPFFAELLAGRTPRRIGDGSNLVCIARRGAVARGPDPAPPGAGRRFATPPRQPGPPSAVPAPPLGIPARQGAGQPDTKGKTMSRTRLRAALRDAARRLPRPVKSLLGRTMARIEARMAPRPQATVALAEAPALLPPHSFRGGPLLNVNNALAWGGVERQVVNTLRGLETRSARQLGLLCLRLGNGPDYEFYRPALVGWRGFVRNIMDQTPAEEALGQMLTGAERARLDRTLGWLPADVQDETRRFVAEFLGLRPEVVHVWQDSASISAGFAARLAGVPRVIVSSRNMNPTNFAYFRPYMHEAYRQLAACPGLTMVNNSEAGARDYAAWLGIPPERFTIKRNGVDLGDFRRAAPEAVAALRQGLGIPEGARVVGGIFRLYEEKRPLLWLAAAAEVAARHPDTHFVIFGTGPLTDTLREKAAASGLAGRLHLPGTIADAALGLSLLDVFLLTSMFEGTPNVVLEASTLGVPVVATAAGGTAEAVAEGRTGHVALDAEPATIAGLVGRILDAPDAWAGRREDGQRFIRERFGLDRMLDETLALYGLGEAPAGTAERAAA